MPSLLTHAPHLDVRDGVSTRVLWGGALWYNFSVESSPDPSDIFGGSGCETREGDSREENYVISTVEYIH